MYAQMLVVGSSFLIIITVLSLAPHLLPPTGRNPVHTSAETLSTPECLLKRPKAPNSCGETWFAPRRWRGETFFFTKLSVLLCPLADGIDHFWGLPLFLIGNFGLLIVNKLFTKVKLSDINPHRENDMDFGLRVNGSLKHGATTLFLEVA